MVPEDRRGWSLAWRRGVAAGLFRPLCSSLISSRFVGERPGSKRTLTCARATSTLIDLFAEVVRSAIQARSGSLCPSRRRNHQSLPYFYWVSSERRRGGQEG